MAFKSILIIVDLDSETKAITRLAEQLSSRTDAKFHILGVVPEFPIPAFRSTQASKTARDMSANLVSTLNEKVAALADSLSDRATSSMVSGRLIEQATQAVMLYQADLVLKAAAATEERSRPVFGSIDKRLIRKCPAPVWVVRPEVGTKFDSIAVAVDRPDIYADSDDRRDLALSLIDHSLMLASFFDIETVHVLYAWDAVGADILRSPRYGISAVEAEDYMRECEQDSRAWLEDFVKIAASRFGDTKTKLSPELVFGRPRVALVDKVQELEADVLIMGTIARSGALGLLIGNTAEDMLDRLECSVLALKPATANVIEDA